MLGAPLAIELMLAAQAMAEMIQKLPPEAQPPALVLALEIISGVQSAALEFVAALPGSSPELRAKAVRKAARRLKRLVKKLPAHAPLSDFAPALAFIAEVEKSVSTLGGLPPTIPQFITPALINKQATMMKKYLTDQVAQ
ncbi:MAG TPA: hypothetical protein VFX96_13770 [Pyrinomonadaceae bacterium]|nr:hypothetical protein [Pyrinomonadaceae bacterium]